MSLTPVEVILRRMAKLTRDEQIFIAKYFVSETFGERLYTEAEVKTVLRYAAEQWSKPPEGLRVLRP